MNNAALLEITENIRSLATTSKNKEKAEALVKDLIEVVYNAEVVVDNNSEEESKPVIKEVVVNKFQPLIEELDDEGFDSLKVNDIIPIKSSFPKITKELVIHSVVKGMAEYVVHDIRSVPANYKEVTLALIIDEDVRRKGLGTLFLDDLIKLWLKEGVDVVEVTARKLTGSFEFLLKNGFVRGELNTSRAYETLRLYLNNEVA